VVLDKREGRMDWTSGRKRGGTGHREIEEVLGDAAGVCTCYWIVSMLRNLRARNYDLLTMQLGGTGPDGPISANVGIG